MKIDFKKGHNASLDGIRGVAILLVLFFHCFQEFKKYPLYFISEIGWVGVDLFFVLSGFLITGVLVDSKDKDQYFKSFYAKRALRIFPLYYLTLIILFGIIATTNISSWNPIFDKRHLQSSFYYLTFTQNLYFSFNGWGVTDILNHFWSLAIEEQFYLFWPFVIFYFNQSKVLALCVVLISIALIVRNYNVESDFSYVFTLSRVDALVIGSMLAILIRNQSGLLDKVILPLFFTVLIALAIIIFNSPNLSFRNPNFVRVGYTLFAILFGCIIAFVYDKKQIGVVTNRILSIKILTFFGTYSYGIYVYHWIFYKGVYIYLKNKYAFSNWYIFVFLIAVVMISVISFHTFEKYFLNFKSRFQNGIILKSS